MNNFSAQDQAVFQKIEKICLRPGITREELTKAYNDWANEYDQDCTPGRYTAPAELVKTLCAHLTDKNQRKTLTVLDVACGSGQVGKLLWDEGFRLIDGLEPAKTFAAKAEATGTYRKMIHEYIGLNQPLSVPNGTYDIVVQAGAFCENHLSKDAIDDMVKMTKPGGVVCFIVGEEYFDTVAEYNEGKLEAKLKQFEDNGNWKLVTRRVFDHFYFYEKGVAFLYVRC